jgi:signal peptidase I
MAETEARDRPVTDVPPTDGGTPDDRGAARTRRFVGSTPFLILVAVGVAILVKTFLVQAFFIPSASMEPTLEVGDRVFVNKFAYDLGDIERGDVIVFENPEPGSGPDRSVVGGFLHWLGEGIGFAQPEDEDFIKRVIGLPGETIEIRQDVVYIDGEPLDEPYLTGEAGRSNGDGIRFEIPAGHLFVMGDNRGNSADSRYGLGFVPVARVIGEAFIVIWPPSRLGGLG